MNPTADTLARDRFVRWWLPNPREDAYQVTEVIGEVPREIRGTLYRNGPSQHIEPKAGFQALHLFDGDGMVHAFRFEDGRVEHRNAFVRNATFAAEEKEGRYCMGGVGLPADPDVDEFESPEIQGRVQHNTNVVHHGGRLLALVENAAPFQIDERSLDPIGPFDLEGRMLGYSTTAHPKIDGRNGDFVIHGYAPFEPYLQLYTLDAEGRCTLAELVDCPYPTMMHDVAITQDHVIFPLCPVIMDFSVMEQGGRFADALSYQPERGMRFGVRGREPGSKIRWFETETPGYLFHFGNAFEQDGKILLDVCLYEKPNGLIEGLRHVRTGHFDPDFYAVPYVYELDLATGTCKERRVGDTPAEFPRIDDRRVGHPNRWGYAVVSGDGARDVGQYFASLVKYDREGGPSQTHRLPEGWHAGEPVFVPRTPDAEEDDGFVLAVVYDGVEDTSELRILDARNFAAEPLARLRLRDRVPGGFHGNFAPGFDGRAEIAEKGE